MATAHRGILTPGGLMDFSPNNEERLEQKINDHIGRALLRENGERPPRNYLGGSALGAECGRKLYFNYHKYPVDEGRELTPRALRIFRAGDIYEDEVARWLRIAGFDLRTHREDGRQYEFTDAGGRIKMHLDGVLLSGPIQLPYPLLWECKSAKDSKWKQFNTHGPSHNPEYWGQLHTYMAYSELRHALWTCINKDTQEIIFRLVPLDTALAQSYVDRAVKVLEASDPRELPRIALEPTNFKCKWCDWHDTCWKLDK